jgi:hypothetical protein
MCPMRDAALVCICFAAFLGDARSEEIAGLGRTVEEAKDDARRHVAQTLLDRLENQSPPRTWWRPTSADLDAFIQGPGRVGKTVPDHPVGVVVHEWILNVQFPTDGELERRDRQAFRGLASSAVVAGLIAICGLWLATAKWKQWTAARRAT